MQKNYQKIYEDPYEAVELSEEDCELLFCKHFLNEKDTEYTDFIFNNFDKSWFVDEIHGDLFDMSRKFWTVYKRVPSQDLYEKMFANSKYAQNKERLTKAFNKIISFNDDKIPEDYVKHNIVSFIKHRATYNIIASYATDIHREGVIAEVIGKLEKTIQIDLDSDLGIEYFSNLDKHIDELQEKDRKVAFQLKMLDKYTKGGLPADDTCLFVIMAPPGLGKSQLMANIARNWVLQNKKVLVISLEMSEKMYSTRFDALFSGIGVNDVWNKTDQLRNKIEGIKANLEKGELRIKEFPTGTLTSARLKEYIKKLRSTYGFVPDLLVVDYLNIMAPNAGGANMTLYEKCGSIAKELRAISSELKIPVLTATQQARGQGGGSGYATDNVDLSNVSESSDISATADALIALTHANEAEIELNRLLVKILKNRLGGYVGAKFYLHADYGNTLRIEDCEDDEYSNDDNEYLQGSRKVEIKKSNEGEDDNDLETI